MINPKIIEQRLLAELSTFDGVINVSPSFFSAINSTTMMTLVEIQDDFPGFDAKALFTFDPETQVDVTWWFGLQGRQQTIKIRFNPLRIDRDKDDLYAAYDRAMKII